MINKTDLNENYVITGNRPQNFILENDPEERFKEHPKIVELLKQKHLLIKKRSTPPLYIKAEIQKIDPLALGQFDVVLIDPPWEEYNKRVLGMNSFKQSEKLEGWSFEEIRKLPIEFIGGNPSFIFLWVGSEHLEHGRMLFKAWGVKRCEDIVWIKSNNKNNFTISHSDEYSFLKRSKEHCIVGIKGDAKKASDPSFIHPNIDTDVILSEETEIDNIDKPTEIYDIIERFCLGRKRIELFGNNKSIRDGWVTVGKDLSYTNFSKENYENYFLGDLNLNGNEGGRLLGTTPEIELIRPKSPPKN